MAQATDDFSALARRYWGMWGDALRDAGAAAGLDAGTQGFRDALDAWRTQAGGQPGLGSLLDHVARQGKDWYAQMQQVALQFAGRDHSARDVAEAWRNALGLHGDPFRDHVKLLTEHLLVCRFTKIPELDIRRYRIDVERNGPYRKERICDAERGMPISRLCESCQRIAENFIAAVEIVSAESFRSAVAPEFLELRTLPVPIGPVGDERLRSRCVSRA